MLATVPSAAVLGVSGYRVTVEADVGAGMPRFLVVGLPDAAVRESRERVISAIRNVGVTIPFERVVVNLAPAGIRKEGASFDLPMAVAVLRAAGKPLAACERGTVFIGELALDGRVRAVRGLLPMLLAVRAAGHVEAVVPHANLAEASVVDGMSVRPLRHLEELVRRRALPDAARAPIPSGPAPSSAPDLRDVRGQRAARRALEIAAVGGHHIGMIGPPGVGKTMLARRLPGILPPLSRDEAIEASTIHSVAGLLGRERPILTARPFRAPHHTTSAAGLVGGASPPRPGEASLAHHGVLFLDELPEVRRDAREALREPLEEGRIRLIRGGHRVVFPARFQFVFAMNPCPCGNLGHPTNACRCPEGAIERHRARVSGPLMDRIDLFLPLSPPRFSELSADDAEPSACVRARVVAARARGNAPMPITKEARRLLERAVEELGFSARAHDRVRRVARTIARLADRERVGAGELAEAMRYRWTETNI